MKELRIYYRYSLRHILHLAFPNREGVQDSRSRPNTAFPESKCMIHYSTGIAVSQIGFLPWWSSSSLVPALPFSKVRARVSLVPLHRPIVVDETAPMSALKRGGVITNASLHYF